MSTTLENLSTQPVPAASRIDSVVMGRSNYLSVLLRLVAMELYKLRRRALSKALSIIGIGTIVLVILLVTVVLIVDVNKPATNFASPLCSQTHNLKPPNCIDHQPTQTELTKYKQASIRQFANLMRLPFSIFGIIMIAVNYNILTPLLIILAGVMVGGEYSLGTVRLIFTRGPTRIQFLLAKLITALICVAMGLLAITIIGVLLGYIFSAISGTVPNFHFFTGAWLAYALLYLLAGMFGWFVYAMIALFFGTLGRSTTAGVVGGLIWLFIEPILSSILPYASALVGGGLGNFLKAIPDYLIGNNVNSLLQNQAHFIIGIPTSSLSDLHSLLVLAGYLIVFISLSCWFTNQRDVTH